jgi:hypothetical protein
VNPELRLPFPLPVAAAVVLAALAAAVFLFVLRAGGGETETPSSPVPASREGTLSVDRKPAKTVPGVPPQLARVLERHRIVVVALVLPDVTVDREAEAEARAGAQTAGVGFVALSARSPEAAEVARKLGFTMTPAVAVVGRDLNPHLRIDGFADRDSVVQAAVSARR